jgi:hypothetical protein
MNPLKTEITSNIIVVSIVLNTILLGECHTPLDRQYNDLENVTLP